VGSTLESIMSEVPGVKSVAVIGQPDDRWGERPVAFVEALPTVSEDDLREILNQAVFQGKLSKFWIPDRISFVKTMPMTSAGKINKAALRAQ